MKYVYSFIQKTKEYILNKYADNGKVLMFHQINNNRNSWIDENTCISLNHFVQLIYWLMERNVNFVSIDHLDNGVLSNKDIYLTFDDAFVDVYQNVFPILKKHNIPFCVFMTNQFIDKNGYLTMGMLKELSLDSLCTIGAHSVSHPVLRFENDKEAFNEIYESKSRLEQLLNFEVKYFAYPYGSIYACSPRDIRLVERAGYKMAFSTLRAHLGYDINEKRYFLPRINVNEKNHLKSW